MWACAVVVIRAVKWEVKALEKCNRMLGEGGMDIMVDGLEKTHGAVPQSLMLQDVNKKQGFHDML